MLLTLVLALNRVIAKKELKLEKGYIDSSYFITILEAMISENRQIGDSVMVMLEARGMTAPGLTQNCRKVIPPS